ncbi:hypothetical protein J6590_083095 [Homalodisca vitripennis]|nr:hypothetical protein J6590_083095 [Homalodisca vitripennis]
MIYRFWLVLSDHIARAVRQNPAKTKLIPVDDKELIPLRKVMISNYHLLRFTYFMVDMNKSLRVRGLRGIATTKISVYNKAGYRKSHEQSTTTKTNLKSILISKHPSLYPLHKHPSIHLSHKHPSLKPSSLENTLTSNRSLSRNISHSILSINITQYIYPTNSLASNHPHPQTLKPHTIITTDPMVSIHPHPKYPSLKPPSSTNVLTSNDP